MEPPRNMEISELLKGKFLEFQLQLGHDGGAAGAEAVFAGSFGVHPATGALLALGLGNTYGQTGEVGTLSNFSAFFGSSPVNSGNNADFSQVQTFAGSLQSFVFGCQSDAGFQSLADTAILTASSRTPLTS